MYNNNANNAAKSIIIQLTYLDVSNRNIHNSNPHFPNNWITKKNKKKQTITRIHCKNDENFIWSWEIKNGSYRVGLYWKQLFIGMNN